jgi:hypothetical protein
MVDSIYSSRHETAWDSLYRAGAICAALTVVLYLAALALYGVAVPPTNADGAAMLDFVVDNRSLYILKQVLWILPGAFLMVTFMALTVALFPLDRSNALIAGVIGVLSWAGAFVWPATGDGSLVLVMLADRYADASTDTERASLSSAAESLIAFNDVPAPLGVLQTMGVLLISLVMLRGVFSKGIAWTGIVTGVIGIASEALRPWLGWAYAVYGILIFAWLGWVAWELWVLYRRREAKPVESLGRARGGNHRVVA